MKSITVLSLSALTVFLLVLFSSSASAMELCKAAEEKCGEENIAAEGTTILAESSSAEITTSLLTATCKSKMNGETMAVAGAPLPIYFSNVEFSECKSGETKCIASTIHLPHQGYLEKTGEDAGTFTLSNWGNGNPGITLECGTKISCTMSAEELNFEAKGGKPATLTASKASLPTHSGSKCPETASLTAKYNIESPSPTHLEGLPSKFCGNTLNVDGTCSMVNVYTGAVKGTMVSAEAVIKVAGGFVINCKEAPLTGANFNKMGIGEINVMEFKTTGAKCSSTITNNPVVKVTIGTPFAASVNFTDIAGMDYLTGGPGLPSVTLEIFNSPAITCVYSAQRSSWRVQSYAPLKIESLWAGNRRDGQPGACPATIVAIEAEYTLKKSADNGNLWIGW